MTVLLVVATIAIFLTLEWVVRRRREATSVPAVALRRQPLPVRVPEGIFFAPNHTWLNLFPSGKVRIGLDDFVGRMLEKPSVAFLKQEGDLVRKGEPILRLNQGSHTLTVRAPIGGTILTRNAKLATRPENMREMLFSDGWAYTLQPAQTTDLRELLFGEETKEWVKNEFARLRDVLARMTGSDTAAPLLLQDGGMPVAGLMKEAPDAWWNAIDEEFLAASRKD